MEYAQELMKMKDEREAMRKAAQKIGKGAGEHFNLVPLTFLFTEEDYKASLEQQLKYEAIEKVNREKGTLQLITYFRSFKTHGVGERVRKWDS